MDGFDLREHLRKKAVNARKSKRKEEKERLRIEREQSLEREKEQVRATVKTAYFTGFAALVTAIAAAANMIIALINYRQLSLESKPLLNIDCQVEMSGDLAKYQFVIALSENKVFIGPSNSPFLYYPLSNPLYKRGQLFRGQGCRVANWGRSPGVAITIPFPVYLPFKTGNTPRLHNAIVFIPLIQPKESVKIALFDIGMHCQVNGVTPAEVRYTTVLNQTQSSNLLLPQRISYNLPPFENLGKALDTSSCGNEDMFEKAVFFANDGAKSMTELSE